MEQKVFNERYKVIEKIGSGGMADVYKAEDLVLGRTVALKILHSQFAEDEGFIARFKREAQSAARLTHPNIVSIYDVGQENGTQFIVMEYVKGTTLKKVIQRDAPMSADRVIHIASQIDKALEFAHDNEIIHRDIKPHNVIITESGEIKVTDFGIARLGSSSTMTRTGAILGTAHYISPEQAQGSVVGPATDIYSLGVVMYEMATGELPFRGENPVAVALKHINDTPLTPRAVFSGIPESMEAIIMKAMAKNTADRYKTAHELQEDLRRALDGMPIRLVGTMPVDDSADISRTIITSQPIRQQAAPRRGRNRRWVWPVVAALAIFLVLGGLALAYYLLTPANVVVPDLKGKTQSQAQKTVEALGLTLVVDKEVENDKVKPGSIVSQDPEAGTKIRKGGIVRVDVSKGLETVKVPNLSGKTQAEAEAALKKAGLTLGNVNSGFSDSAPEGTVISQSPQAGSRIGKGETVDITISSGSQSVTVPEVVDKTKAEAVSILENAGFKVNTVDDYSDTVAEDHVIRQSPDGGEKATRGSTITIAVSKGPKTITMKDLTGLTEAEAVDWLNSNGLVPNVDKTPKAGIVSGFVWDQDVPSGTKVDKGSTVNIKVQP